MISKYSVSFDSWNTWKYVWKFDLGFFFFVFCKCVNVCMYTMCIPGKCGSQKQSLDALEWELQTVVRCSVGARNRTSQEQPSFLTSPLMNLFNNSFMAFLSVPNFTVYDDYLQPGCIQSIMCYWYIRWDLLHGPLLFLLDSMCTLTNEACRINYLTVPRFHKAIH